MFWGLIMEPHKRYTQTVKKAFHVSMAALDITNSDSEPTQVLCTSENRNYLLCTLQKDKVIQCPLELTFEAGDKISFAANGNSHVHLTGYLTSDYDDYGEEEEEEELEDFEALEVEEVEKPVNPKKRALKSLDEPVGKKLKTAELLDAVDSHSEDSDDATFSNLEELEEEEDNAEEDEDDVEDEDSTAEEDSDEDDEEDEDDESDEDDEAEEPPQISKKQQKLVNGTSTPGKKTNNVQVKTPPKKPEEVKTPKQEKAKTPNEKKGKPEQKTPKSPKDTPKKRTIEGGVVIEDLKQGEGQVAKPGKVVQVYYEGRLKNNNKMFDSTLKGPGFKFRLGRQEVIKGWDAGINGMKVGGKRRLICPANMAYGQKGSPPVIPPNATLVFDVELKAVH